MRQSDTAGRRPGEERGHRPGPGRRAHRTRASGLLHYPVTILLAIVSMTGSVTAQVGAGPIAAPLPPSLPRPLDRAFEGTVRLLVNATDTDHQVFSVHEEIPVQKSGDTVLLYPKWDTASHAPTATVTELAGLVIRVDGVRVEWLRDTVAMHAFHVNVPKGAHSIALDFQFLAPPTSALLRHNMVAMPWLRVLLYPAGWYVRDIPVSATLVLPVGLTPFTALTFHRVAGKTVRFSPVTLQQLVDAPVYAGRYTRRILLNGSAAPPVNLDLLADEPGDLAITPGEIGRLRVLVAQTLRTFGGVPYRHYDMLVTLSDVLSPGGGVEHLEEGENNLPAKYFTHPEGQLNNLDLIAHEFVHAWNGCARQPAGLWSPTFNEPVVGALLWVYEGQTEFWGRVLAARAGLRDRQQTLDELAMDAAVVANRDGRSWKSLEDSTNDAIYMAKHRVSWRDWQRREDYYPEGVLLWLDVDARLRELSHGRHGLDDFARLFFDVLDGGDRIRTYTFRDVCAALNEVAPNDWTAFLERHLRTHNTREAMAGLPRAGWKLIYTPTPSAAFREEEADSGVLNLDYSIGMQIDTDGTVQSVRWGAPAFRAGLSPGARVIEVDGQPFSPRALSDAVQASASRPPDLRVDIGGIRRVVSIDYRGGLRYPHLERIADTPDRLSALLEAR